MLKNPDKMTLLPKNITFLTNLKIKAVKIDPVLQVDNYAQNAECPRGLLQLFIISFSYLNYVGVFVSERLLVCRLRVVIHLE